MSQSEPRKDLIRAREKLGLTQADVARASGVDTGLLSRIEAGKRRVGLTTAPTLAKTLQLPVEAVLYPVPDPDADLAELRNEEAKTRQRLAEIAEQIRFTRTLKRRLERDRARDAVTAGA